MMISMDWRASTDPGSQLAGQISDQFFKLTVMNEHNINNNPMNLNEKLINLGGKTHFVQADGTLFIMVVRAAGQKRCNRGNQ